MTYPADVEQKLGFDQLRSRLANYCRSGLGLRELERVAFSADFNRIQTLLRQAEEFKTLLQNAEPLPEGDFFDPEALLKTVVIEDSFIEAEELAGIARSLQLAVGYRAFFSARAESYPELLRLADPVRVPATLTSQIAARIDDAGVVRDHASPELSGLRKALKEEQRRVRQLTERLYRQAVSQGWVPDGASPTVRDGRVVIPLLAEHKRKLAGVIADESATGQTIYLEPTEVLESNNEIRDLEHQVRREIIRILKTLTGLLRAHLAEVAQAFVFLGQMEITRAKARLAIDMTAGLPHLMANPGLTWWSARHPLLHLTLKGKRAVVPLTIDLPDDCRMLLISGPNAGGKSVCLKTVGLIQYMVQCGLLIPVDEKSTAGIFENIFLDIGDQQSIENDLSTYSSHLKNLNYFIRHATPGTLVLMDELGAGTDPDFGGGIAQAILDSLVKKGVWGIATTHYYNLKVYAGGHPGIRNGAMLFDSEKLEPLFQLEIGKPGSSFALEIARKTGLPQSTLEAAEAVIGKELTGLESLIKTVADDKQAVRKKEAELKQQEQVLSTAKGKYDRLSQELETRKKEILEKARNEASFLLKETNREIEKTIRHIRENNAEKKETRKVRQSLKGLTEKVNPVQPVPAPATPDASPVDVGDYVRIIGQEVSGRVLSRKGDMVVVQFGDLRSQLHRRQLVRSDQAEVRAASTNSQTGVHLYQKQSAFTGTLDVRGKRVEEVLPLLDRFLDDALLLGRGELRILHGKGEGVLRKVIRERLRSVRQVASVADEHVERGGDGISVVILK
jgi:DNA mismatch repair protein MutS2